MDEPEADLAMMLGRTVRLWLLLLGVTALAIGSFLVLSRLLPQSGLGVRSTPSVVVAVRDLARIESVQYHVERVIDVRDRQSTLFGLIKTQDALLLVAAGDVTAGVDLSELQEGDVTIDQTHSTARITLPPATVLVTRLDNDHTWVYSRTTDLLAQRHEDLETRARQEAERTLQQAALDSGILDRARTNAENTVATLVRSLGYTTVVVTSRAGIPR